jgi:hypothetical protein
MISQAEDPDSGSGVFFYILTVTKPANTNSHQMAKTRQIYKSLTKKREKTVKSPLLSYSAMVSQKIK